MKKISLMLLFISCLVTGASYAAQPVIFVSISPQKWLVEKIVGDLLPVGVLVDGSQDPHSFEPTPRKVVSLSAASIYFTLNMEFENRLLGKIKPSMPNLKVFDSTTTIKRIAMDQGHEDHQHEKMHHTLVADPHVWLSPLNCKLMAEQIANTLKKIYPHDTMVFDKNLADFNKEMDLLQLEVSEKLKPYAGSSFYVFHPSFGYFAHTYDLKQFAVEVSGKSPTPKQLSLLIKKLKDNGARIIFTQPQFDQRSSMAIAKSIDGQVIALDPMAENIGENIRQMAESIANSFGAP